MTIWLTDCPEQTGLFLPPGMAWKPLDARGYSLPAGTFLPSLQPGKPWWSAHVDDGFDAASERTGIVVDVAEKSQFDAVLEALRQGENLPDRLVCLALTGARFRGQRQRSWSALRGNLHLTAHYRIDRDAVSVQTALTMIPSVVAAEAVAEISRGRLRPAIKWVNDVWLGGAKVCGVLTATTISGQNVERVVFGIGMNVEQAPKIEATPFAPRAGCLGDADPGLRHSLPELFHDLVRRLDQATEDLRADRPARIFERYCALAGFVGQEVRIWPEGEEDWRSVGPVVCGRVTSLNPDLSLNIEGMDQPVRSGRMAYESSCRQV